MTVRYAKTLKKTVIIVLSLVLLLFGLTACGLGDWRYDELPDNYEIWHSNAQCMDLVKVHDDGNSGSIVIKSYVLEFCCNDSYIGIKRVPHDFTKTDKSIDEIDKSNPEYYLIDASIEKTYGPYTFEEYKKCLEELQVGDLGKWIKTSPPPEGARYD